MIDRTIRGHRTAVGTVADGQGPFGGLSTEQSGVIGPLLATCQMVKGRCWQRARWSRAVVGNVPDGQGPLLAPCQMVKGRCWHRARWSRAVVGNVPDGQGPLLATCQMVKGRCWQRARWSRAVVGNVPDGQGPLLATCQMVKGRCWQRARWSRAVVGNVPDGQGPCRAKSDGQGPFEVFLTLRDRLRVFSSRIGGCAVVVVWSC